MTSAHTSYDDVAPEAADFVKVYQDVHGDKITVVFVSMTPFIMARHLCDVES
jgi:hypothetical protein